MTVRIGIPDPTSGDWEYNQKFSEQYAGAVREAGAEPVRLTLALHAKELRRVATMCNGFLLPGSPADVSPELYGEQAEETTAAADAVREETDRWLLEHAAATGKPVLAICFGMQFLNVWRGGSLVQDLSPMPVNHAAGAGVAVAHTTVVTGQSLLASLLSATEAPGEGAFRRLPINSSHHQAVSRVGEDLAIVGRCGQDGVVEAVEGRVGQATMLGVQWHPERSVGISAASRALFTWLVCGAEDVQMSGGQALDD